MPDTAAAGSYVNPTGEFTRDQRYIATRITADGRDGFQEAYFARFPGYDRGVTVPAIVDVPTGQVVTNDYSQITLDLPTQWRAHHRSGAPDLYPEDHRVEIDDVNRVVFTDVNNGVYRCGFAGTQAAYEAAYHRLFDRLDTIDFDHIKRHYYQVHRDINPTGIVPAGPDLAGWLRPHGRDPLAGRPPLRRRHPTSPTAAERDGSPHRLTALCLNTRA